MSSKKLPHLRIGKKTLDKGHVLSCGESFSIGVRNNVFAFLNGDSSINYDLVSCTLENLDAIIETLEAYNKQIVRDSTKEMISFGQNTDGLNQLSKINKGLLLFLSNFIATLRILINDKKIQLNPLKNLKKQLKQENMILILLQGMFIGLILKIKQLKKSTNDQERGEKYNELIGICRRIINSLGKKTNTNIDQINFYS